PSRGVTIRLGNGDLTFGSSSEVATSLRATAIAVGDFNRDGNLDFVVADDSSTGSVGLRLGDGTGKFTGNTTFAVGINPSSLATADVNRDGYLDVIVTSRSTTTSDKVSVLLNTLGSGFSPFVSTQ